MVLPEAVRMVTSIAGDKWAYDAGAVYAVGDQLSEGQAAMFLERGLAVPHQEEPEPPNDQEPASGPERDSNVEAAVVKEPETAALRTGRPAKKRPRPRSKR